MKKLLFTFFFAATLYSCATYTVAPDSFREQFLAVGSTMEEVQVNNPILPATNITYKANTIKKIKVVDKNGNIDYIENSPSIEMRVTQTNGKRRVVYFDTVELRNDTLYGSGSRLIGTPVRRIPFDSIAKIEIQDGGKNYHYQN